MTNYGITHLPGFLPAGRILTNNEAITEALDVLEYSGLKPVLRRVHTQRPGPAPKLTYLTLLLLAIAFKVQVPKRDFLQTDLARWASTLTPRQSRRVGLPTQWKLFQLYVAFQGLRDLLEPADSEKRFTADGELTSPRRGDVPPLPVFINALVGASCRLPHWAGILPPTPVQAIDSTDIETSAQPKAGTKEPDSPDSYRPENAKPGDEWSEDSSTWPRRSPVDGRLVISADLEARIGWRTRTLGRATNHFNGYDAHTLVDAGAPGMEFWVPVIRGAFVGPAGGYKAQAGLDLLDSLLGGIHFTHLAADRGYSYAKPEAWASQLAARNIIGVHDLHTGQRRPHPTENVPGAFWLDGSLFPDALPQRLRKIPGFKVRSTQAEIDHIHALYDERSKWAFTPNRRYDNGDVQFKGPARAGHIRCPNYAPSERLPASTPRATCLPDVDCACAVTRVISATEAAWERQRYIYGTTRWAAYYGLRNLVESQNAQLKHWRGSMRSRSTLLFGTTANALVFALNCIAVNRSMLRDAYGDELDPTATDYKAHQGPRRRRAPRSTPLHLRKTTPRRSTTRRDPAPSRAQRSGTRRRAETQNPGEQHG